MKQHPGLLIVTGFALFSVTVAAALNPPVDGARIRLEHEIENLEREHEIFKTWADSRLVPWANRVARLQERLAEAAAVPVPSVAPLPPVPVPSLIPSPPPPPPVPSQSPSPSCILIPIANVCLGDPSPPPHPEEGSSERG